MPNAYTIHRQKTRRRQQVKTNRVQRVRVGKSGAKTVAVPMIQPEDKEIEEQKSEEKESVSKKKKSAKKS